MLWDAFHCNFVRRFCDFVIKFIHNRLAEIDVFTLAQACWSNFEQSMQWLWWLIHIHLVFTEMLKNFYMFWLAFLAVFMCLCRVPLAPTCGLYTRSGPENLLLTIFTGVIIGSISVLHRFRMFCHFLTGEL